MPKSCHPWLVHISKLLLFLLMSSFLNACASGFKKESTLTASDLFFQAAKGQKLALVSIEGEETDRKIVEAALINQLSDRAPFELIPRQEIEQTKISANLDSLDSKDLASRVKADYALTAKILKFESKIREGFSKEDVFDSELAAEQGTDGKTEEVFKTKTLNAVVEIELQFTQLATGKVERRIAQASDTIEANSRRSSIHFPPQLRFLEKLTNKAFKDFFDQYTSK